MNTDQEPLKDLIEELIVNASTSSTVFNMRQLAIKEHNEMGIQLENDVQLLQSQLTQQQLLLESKKQQNKIADLLKKYKSIQSKIWQHSVSVELEKKNVFNAAWDTLASVDVEFE